MFSPLLVFVVIINLSLYGVYSERYPEDHSKYEMPLNGGPEDEVVDIGNGKNKHNVVLIEESDQLGNRFGEDPHQRPWSKTTNIGNGKSNRNTVVIGEGGQRTDFPDQSKSNSWKNGGTGYIRNGNQGWDVLNVGYGKDNENRVTVEGVPVQPDCFGTACDDVKKHPRTNSASKTNQAFLCFSLFLVLSTLF